MITSTTLGKKTKIKWWAVLLWLLVWQIASMNIGQEILLVSPVRVVQRLFQLVQEVSFWNSIAYSFTKIVRGFILALVLGILMGGLSARFSIIRNILALPVAVVKATPVASFIILALVWIDSNNLSVFISFLMVFPIVYTNIITGIESTDKKLLEMAKVFGIPKIRRIRYIYFSQVMPFLRSSCLLGLGLCWKAGIAAEVIGIPKGSIGEKLYDAKIYLETPDLFAWTVVIIFISIVFEKLFMWLLDRIMRFAERM